MLSHPLILGHLTVLDVPPPDVITIASQTGFRQVGLRLYPSRPDSVHYPLWKDQAMLAETIRRMDDTGVSVFDFDVIRLTAETKVEALEPVLETAGTLGAKSALVTAGDPDRSRFTETFAAFADLARPYGVVADLEYMKFTPTVPDLATAIEIARAVGRENVGVLHDTIHVDRLGADYEAIKATPPAFVHYVHFTDARPERPTTNEGLIEDTRAYRMMPGEGGIDLVSFARALPPGTPLCIEVSNRELDQALPAIERARRAKAGAEKVLKAVEGCLE